LPIHAPVLTAGPEPDSGTGAGVHVQFKAGHHQLKREQPHVGTSGWTLHTAIGFKHFHARVVSKSPDRPEK